MSERIFRMKYIGGETINFGKFGQIEHNAVLEMTGDERRSIIFDKRFETIGPIPEDEI